MTDLIRPDVTGAEFGAEPRLLIDGKLVEARSGETFDTTDWSTNHALRKRGHEQLQEAIVGEQELFRAELVAEVGTPVMVTSMAQLDEPLKEALLWPASMIDQFEWERDLPDGNAFGQPSRRKVVKEAAGVVGAILR